MTARRREKLKKLAHQLPLPEVFGDREGDTLLVGWGSTFGPIREAVKRSRADGNQLGHLHLRHIHPLPNGLERIFSRYRQIFVVEMNDQGLYGFGQLATLLRARFANGSIRSITKTDGLPFKVREIREGISLLKGDATASVSSYPNI
jgi:2-oxoglutarate ferredoxin oxidoreductase subunit alpha